MLKLGAESFLLVAEFRREGGAKVLRLEHLPNLNLGFLVHRIGTALDPFDRLLQRRLVIALSVVSMALSC